MFRRSLVLLTLSFPLISRNSEAPAPATNAASKPNWPSHSHFIRYPGSIEVKVRDSYIVAYDKRTRNAVFVSQHLTKAGLSISSGDRKKSDFKEDYSIAEKHRSKNEHYLKSGYDRGHLCPAADAKGSQGSMDSTFLLTNISPQVGEGFNRHYWARMEAFARNMAMSFGEAWVVSGPLYLPTYDPQTKKWSVHYECIGDKGQVAVPTHFFKVIMIPQGKNKYAIGAFVLPNKPIHEDTPLQNFIVDVGEVERVSGLSFLEAPVEVLAAATAPIVIEQLCSRTECKLPPGYKQKGGSSHEHD